MPKPPKQLWELSTAHFRDIHGPAFVEAYCPHGIGHHKGTHGCDGCCANAPKAMWDKVSKD